MSSAAQPKHSGIPPSLPLSSPPYSSFFIPPLSPFSFSYSFFFFLSSFSLLFSFSFSSSSFLHPSFPPIPPFAHPPSFITAHLHLFSPAILSTPSLARHQQTSLGALKTYHCCHMHYHFKRRHPQRLQTTTKQVYTRVRVK